MMAQQAAPAKPVDDVPGVGAKTAARLADLGIETATELAAAYLRGDAVVDDVLARERKLVQAIVEGDIDVTGADIGVPGTDGAPAALAFARVHDVGDTYLSEQPSPFSDECITPEMIDWETGLIVDDSDVFGVVYDPEAASRLIDMDIERASMEPLSVGETDEGHVEYRLGGASTIIDEEFVETLESFTGRSYRDRGNVRVHPARNFPARFEIGATGAWLISAPRERT